jgi:hypothetical protein
VQQPPSVQPNASGTDTYRVAVRAEVNGVLRAVSASMFFNIVPW